MSEPEPEPAAAPSAATPSAAAKASSDGEAAMPWLSGRNVVLAVLVVLVAFGVKQFGALASEKISASFVWARGAG